MDIVNQRLFNQQLSVHRFKSPEKLVGWFGAMQAQDFGMAKWAIGCRIPDVAESVVEKDFNEGKILRTHVLRPTWHFVSPKDIRWMLALTASKIRSLAKPYHRQLEIDAAILKKSKRIIGKIMGTSGPMTRNEIERSLSASGIRTNENRLGHLLMDAELEGLICSAGRKGKQFAYGLLQSIVSDDQPLEREAAIVKLARRYFFSHGPATIPDFSWWSGLSISEIKLSLPLVDGLQRALINGHEYWFSESVNEIKGSASGVIFLPAYDEYFLGYHDRSDLVDPKNKHQVLAGNGIFSPTVISRGLAAGTWKKKDQRSGIAIEYSTISGIRKIGDRSLNAAMQKYLRFIGREGKLIKIVQSEAISRAGKK